jgi:hypothetical protein
MALKSSSPLNLAALRQDYSMLPKIAAVKAQANQQMIGAIQSGLEKRKERIEKKEKNALNEKLLQDLIDSDPNNAIFPADVTNKELAKYITLEETMAHRRALDTANRAAAKEAQLIQAARNAAQKLGLPPGAAEANPRGVLEAAMKAQIESLKGTEPKLELVKVTDPDGTERTVIVNVGKGTSTNIIQQPTAPTPPQASSRPPQVRLPGGLTASRVDPKAGRPPVQSAPSGKPLTSFPSLAERNAAEKARKDAILEDVRQNIKGKAQSETGAFRATPEVISRVAEDYKGILTEEEVAAIGADLTEKYNLRGRDLIQRFSKDDPQFEEYLTALSKLPEDTKLQKDLFNIDSPLDLVPSYAIGKAIRNYFQGKEEFEAGAFDLESIEKYNERIRRNPEMAQAAGLPERLYDLIKSGRMSEEVQEKKEINLPDGTSVSVYGNSQTAPVQYDYPTVPQIQSF